MMSNPISPSPSAAVTANPSATTQTQYPVKKWRHDPGSGWYTRSVDAMECESLRSYENGGLCPVLLGDVLSGVDILQQGKEDGKEEVCSFKVLGKLGRGTSSTVWLGRDMQNGDRHLVLKVLRHEDSSPDNPELRILRNLGKGKLQVAFFYMPLKENQLRYLCFGLKPQGATLLDLETLLYNPFHSLRIITEFMKTFIEKVVELHRLGVCHGDISYSNVAFGARLDKAFKPDALKSTFDETFLYKSYVDFFGPENPQPPRPPHLPEYILQSSDAALETDWEDMSKIDLLDFGSAFEGPSSEKIRGTAVFLPPEVVPKTEDTQLYTAKSDLWSLGSVIIYGLTTSQVFNHRENRENYINATEREEQLNIIRESLCDNKYLKQHQSYCWAIAHILHSLIRVDPALRDADVALKLLEDLKSEVEKEALMDKAHDTK